MRRLGCTGLLWLVTACSSVPNLPFVGEAESKQPAPVETTKTEGAVKLSVAPPPSPKFLPGDLLGLTPPQLESLVGQPSFVRREGLGEFHRYNNQRCNLIVIFQQDASGRIVSSSLDTTAFTSSLEKPELQSCLNGF